MKDFVNKTESTYIPDLNGALKNLDGELSRNKEHFKDVITKIQSQNNKLKQELDKITNQLIKICRDTEEQNNDILKKQKTELQLKIEKLGARLRELKDALQTGSDTQVYDISREIPNDVTIPALSSLQDVDFNATSVIIDQLETLMAQLSRCVDGHRVSVKSPDVPSQQHATSGTDDANKKTTPSLQDQTATGLEKSPNIKTFEQQYATPEPTDIDKKTTDTLQDKIAKNLEKPSKLTFELFKSFIFAGYITEIVATSPNHVMVNLGNGVLKSLDHTGQIIKVMDTGNEIYFCASPSSGDVLFFSCEDNSVRKITGDQKSAVMFYTDIKSMTGTFFISADGNILVGMEKQIVKYTQRGQILCKSTQVKQVPVVRYPASISQCPVTRNIAVLDSDNKYCGGDGKKHVSILGEDLQLLCRYYGQDINLTSPNDVCYSDTGDIYVCDRYKGSIQRINGRGEFIQTVYTNSDEEVTCLCVQFNGDIWAVFDGVTVMILQKQN